jgi:hypothetical protein
LSHIQDEGEGDGLVWWVSVSYWHVGESERESEREREKERESNILNGWKILCGEAKETCLAGGIGSYALPSLFYPCHYSTERP